VYTHPFFLRLLTSYGKVVLCTPEKAINYDTRRAGKRRDEEKEEFTGKKLSKA
jgi:hypothetical protein